MVEDVGVVVKAVLRGVGAEEEGVFGLVAGIDEGAVGAVGEAAPDHDVAEGLLAVAEGIEGDAGEFGF